MKTKFLGDTQSTFGDRESGPTTSYEVGGVLLMESMRRLFSGNLSQLWDFVEKYSTRIGRLFFTTN